MKQQPKKTMKAISLNLPDHVHHFLKKSAAEYGVSMTALARCIVVVGIIRELEENFTFRKAAGTTAAAFRKSCQEFIIPEVEAKMMSSNVKKEPQTPEKAKAVRQGKAAKQPAPSGATRKKVVTPAKTKGK